MSAIENRDFNRAAKQNTSVFFNTGHGFQKEYELARTSLSKEIYI